MSKPLYEEVLAPSRPRRPPRLAGQPACLFRQAGGAELALARRVRLAGRLEIALRDAAPSSVLRHGVAAGARADREPGATAPRTTRPASSTSTATRSKSSSAARPPRCQAPQQRNSPPRVENLADIVPLAGTLGIEVSKAEPDEVLGRMDWAPGALHRRRGAPRRRADGVRRHTGRRLRLPQSSGRRGDDRDRRVEDELLPRRP